MKFNASAQDAFSFNTAFPRVSPWEGGSARRARYSIRPFSLKGTAHDVGQRDELARKQEIICTIILGLCLVFTVAVCLAQLARF